jgi:hypothetical protein
MAHIRSRMNSGKVNHEQSPCKAFKGPLHSLGFAHEPHEHVILCARINDDIDMEWSGPTNRFVVPVFPEFLHFGKTFLDHGSDELHFLSDLRWQVRKHTCNDPDSNSMIQTRART